MTGLLVLAAVAYFASVARGVRRSRGNLMASTIRRRHSWRWWLWTALARPSFWIEFRPPRAGVWIGRRRVALPVGLFPDHMRPATRLARSAAP